MPGAIQSGAGNRKCLRLNKEGVGQAANPGVRPGARRPLAHVGSLTGQGVRHSLLTIMHFYALPPGQGLFHQVIHHRAGLPGWDRRPEMSLGEVKNIVTVRRVQRVKPAAIKDVYAGLLLTGMHRELAGQ